MKRLIPILILLILGVGGGMVEMTRQRERSVLSGFFESQPTVVASRTAGRVLAIPCPEGTTVKAEQVLLELEVAPGEADARALQEAARQAQSHYQEIKAGPRQEDIQHQEATVAELQADLDKAVHGARPAEIEAARAHYQQAQAVYARSLHGPTREERGEARDTLAGTRARTEFARSDLQRQRTLFKEDATSRQAVDRAQSDFDAALAAQKGAAQANRQARIGTRTEDIQSARADMEYARQQYILLAEGNRPEDVAAARARLQAAQAQLSELQHGNRVEDVVQARDAAQAAEAQSRSEMDKLSERQVKAPIGGNVERVLVAVGDLVSQGTPLVRLADPTDLWMRVYVPENQLAKVKVGDSAELRVDGISETVAARVDTLATQGEFTPANLQTPADRGKQVFAVRLRLAQPDARVKAGMEATVKRVGEWP